MCIEINHESERRIDWKLQKKYDFAKHSLIDFVINAALQIDLWFACFVAI